jgi:hypothetical protein
MVVENLEDNIKLDLVCICYEERSECSCILSDCVLDVLNIVSATEVRSSDGCVRCRSVTLEVLMYMQVLLLMLNGHVVVFSA